MNKEANNMSKNNTVHGSGGTDWTVSPGGVGWIMLASQDSREGLQGWTGSLTIEESKHLRLLLEEAEIEAKPKPSKAERIRAEFDRLRFTPGADSICERVFAILDEDGDL